MATTTLVMSARRTIGFALCLFISTGLALAPDAAQSPGNIGYQDFSYGTTATSRPTGEKPQSKVWWNDGFWWGYLFSTSANRYQIHRLDTSTQTWATTGVAGDDRPTSKADVLWVGATQKLYVASNSYSSSAQATSSTSRWARLYRFSYDAGQNQYSLDSGFPVTISGATAEALTIARDSTGRLWATWVQNARVMVNHSTSGDLNWATPFVLPVSQSATTMTSDDISAVVAFGGNRVGVMWSNQANARSYFSVHWDSDLPATWQTEETALPGPGCSGACADDHISLQADSQGQVYVAVKTSLTGSNPLILLLVRQNAGGWTSHVFGMKADNHTRPVVLLDEGNNRLFLFATAPETDGVVYYKTTALNNIGFGPGRGTPFISNSSDSGINDAATSKAAATAASGILVIASSETTRRYYHNVLSLGGTPGPVITSFSPASGAPGTLVTITGSNLNGATEVLFGQAPSAFTVISGTEIRATVPGGASSGRIVVTTPNGTGVSSNDFIVTLPPTVQSFSPASGPVGAAVSISGSNFSGATQVRFGGVSATFTVTSASTISSTVPAGATTGRISVTTSSGTGQSSVDFVVTTGGGGGGNPNRLRDATFESGALIDVTTGVDRINGSVGLETGSPLKGTYAARVPGSPDSYLEVNFAASSDIYVSISVRVLALPAADARIAQISNSGTTVGNIMLLPTGALRLRSGSTNTGATSAPLAVGQDYRIGLRQRSGSGGNAVLEAFVAPIDNAFGAPFASLTTGTWTTAANRLRLGATTPTAVNAIFDDIRIDAGAMPGPAGPPLPAPEPESPPPAIRQRP